MTARVGIYLYLKQLEKNNLTLIGIYFGEGTVSCHLELNKT